MNCYGNLQFVTLSQWFVLEKPVATSGGGSKSDCDLITVTKRIKERRMEIV